MSTGLVLLTRPDCGLCEQFLADLQALAGDLALPPIHTLDVDTDPALARRFGLDIPVLLWDGVKVCEHQLDRAELTRLARRR